jgi:hypothetical protein
MAECDLVHSRKEGGRQAVGKGPRSRASLPLHRLMLSVIVAMIEIGGLQIGVGHRVFGKRGLGQNLGRNIVDRAIRDFVNETDVLCIRRKPPAR